MFASSSSWQVTVEKNALVGALNVAGVIQINGRDHLIINQAPYKEGDVIIARAKGQPVYLRLKVISRFTFTLSYNDSELAVKY